MIAIQDNMGLVAYAAVDGLAFVWILHSTALDEGIVELELFNST